jgi:putative chitinase
MAIDRAKFFDGVRSGPFPGKLNQTQVNGMNAILDAWQASGLTDPRWLAYMLATVLAECGPNMQPVREGFKKSDADARAYVKSRGYKYAKEVNGQVYYGRGLVQLTWEANYQKMGGLLGIDLVNDPDLALDPDTASKIMFKGMTLGTFTGKKLSDYFGNGSDWRNARRIINKLDRADEIATYGKQFHSDIVNATA